MKSLICFLSLAAVAFAQSDSRPAAVRAPNGTFAFPPLGPVMGRTVTGMPYSAEQITEHVQTLADGTHITSSPQKTIFYRDSQGRTRIEHTFPHPPGMAPQNTGPDLIEIADPVSGVSYSLETRNHVARQLSRPAPPPPPPPASDSTASARRSLPPAGVISAIPATAPQAKMEPPKFSRESLGTQTIEGVTADGVRTTTVYPEGFFGNDRPITVVTETWTSPELKLVVLSKTSDPRTGEHTTRLTNISRAEPDPSLFQVPPDYQIADTNH